MNRKLIFVATLGAFCACSAQATTTFEKIETEQEGLVLLKKTSEGTVNHIFSGTVTGAYQIADDHLSTEGRMVVNSANGREVDGWADCDALTFTLANDYSGALVTSKTSGQLVDLQVNRAHTLTITGGKNVKVGSIWLQRSKVSDKPTIDTKFVASGSDAQHRLHLTVNGDIKNYASTNSDPAKLRPGVLAFTHADVLVTGSVGEAGAGQTEDATPFEELNVTLNNANLTVGGDLLGMQLTNAENSNAVVNVGGTMSGEFALAGATVSAGALHVEGDGQSQIGELKLNGGQTGVTLEESSGNTQGLKLDKVTGNGSLSLDNAIKVEMESVDGDMDLVFNDADASAQIDQYGEKGDVTLVVGKNLNDGSKPLDELVEEVAGKVTGNKDKMDDFVVQEGSGNNLSGGASGTLGADGSVDSIVEKQHTTVTTLGEIADLSVMMWRAEANDINLRLGDLRSSNGNNGLWVRTYGGKNEYGASDLENEFYALQLGYDHQVGSGATKIWTGGAINYTEGDSTFTNGTGNNRTMALTLYGSWLFENGSFIDTWAKYGTMKNEFDKFGGYEGAFDTQALAFGLEVGHRIDLASSFFVEPQVEAVYSHIFSESYDAGNAVKVEQDAVDSITARAGAMVGWKLPQDKGSVYARASYVYDFDGETSANFIGKQTVKYANDLGGGWYELGIGANYSLTDNTYVYADVEYEGGGEIDTPFRWNCGVRHTF